jgi:hypothetical protein
MIAKVEKMNMRQENHEEGQETKDMLENQKESESMLLQLKETLNRPQRHQFTRDLKRETMHRNQNRRLRHRLCLG